MSNRHRALFVVLLALFPLLWFGADYLLHQYETLRGSKQMAGGSRWYKGNTHTHSLWSDGNDFPEMIVKWYHERDYDFLVLSDHNVLSRGEKWMAVADVERRRKGIGHPVLAKYKNDFGEDWVETREGEKGTEVRIKALEEFRERFEKVGKFLLIEGEEITDRFQEGTGDGAKKYDVHINATNVQELIKPQGGTSVRDVMRNNFRAVAEQEKETGKPILAHLNHPNFGWSITAEDLAHVEEGRFFEVYNGHPGINHLGRPASGDQPAVPSDEEIWDLANTMRLRELKMRPIFGVATDDSHHYHGGDVSPGRGWIMVYAEALRPKELIEAMRAGSFYASTGVALSAIHYDPKVRELRVDIDAGDDTSVKYVSEVIGSLKEGTVERNTGVVLDTFDDNHIITHALSEEVLYVRVRVTSNRDHPNPSFSGQKQQAWTQPVGWESMFPSPDPEAEKAEKAEKAE